MKLICYCDIIVYFILVADIPYATFEVMKYKRTHITSRKYKILEFNATRRVFH